IALLLLFVLFAVTQCTNWRADRRVAEQARQSERSAEAINEAARAAVNRVVEQDGAENSIDDAVAAAQKEINHAQSSDDVHAAVVRHWCMRPSNRNDAACKVR